VCISAASFSRNPSLSSSLIGVLSSWGGTSFSFAISSSGILARGLGLRNDYVRFEGHFLFSFVARAGTMIFGLAYC
jgi:hypothetical protein